MILQKLRLHPFAGISDLTVDFREGLNIILGPNEAGKSTLVNGLRMLLFMPVKYSKPRFNNEISRFMPVSGGDTIRGEISFLHNASQYHLKKSWGATDSNVLKLPDGGEISDVAAVGEKLQELLVLKEGTYHTVLITYQSKLTGTLEAIAHDPSATHDLNAVLRKAIFETDGISIDRLQDKIQSRFSEYFEHWDRTLNLPEKGKDIDNQWLKGRGKILEAYYRKEGLKNQLQNALTYEHQLDDINQTIQTVSSTVKELKDFISGNKKRIEDARQCMIVSARLKEIRREEDGLREISRGWPAVLEAIKNGSQNLKELEEKSASLQREKEQADLYESGKKMLDKFRRASRKKEELQKAKKELGEIMPVSDEDFGKLENLSRGISRIETSLKAGRLSLQLEAKEKMELNVAQDLNETGTFTATPEQPLEFSAGGQIKIEHEKWRIRVNSGEADFEKLQESFSKSSKEYQALLDRLKTKDLPEAAARRDAYKKAKYDVTTLKAQLAEILEDDNFEKLAESAKKLQDIPATRSLMQIAEEAGHLAAKKEQLSSQLSANQQLAEQWEKEYVSQENLLDQLIEKRAKVKGMEKKNTEADFSRVTDEGNAIIEIQETFQKIKSELDANTLDPWISEIKSLIAPLTGNRYQFLKMDERNLHEVVRQDGMKLPFDYLSVGTKDGMALALRLSMAKYFLKELDGFLVMDDPLVDMDPERQDYAAEAIRRFGEEKQIIILTCHPSHANLLGAHIIRI
ncbi:MAG: AAA family ATPase [Calditrichia bacterium]